MGTIIDKLEWLWSVKVAISNILHTKLNNINKTTTYTENSNFQDLLNQFSSWDFRRRRLVPVMTQYLQYSYGTANGVTGYYNDFWFDYTDYNWANDIVPITHCALGGFDAENMLTRSETGVVMGKVVSPYGGATVANLPFCMGCGSTADMGNQSGWMNGNALYAGISYYYSITNMKILLADDATKNDGVFILGNIALVDPLLFGSSISDLALVCISYRLINPSYTSSSTNTTNWIGIDVSVTRNSAGNYTLTWNVGYNNYNYIWPLFTGIQGTSGGSAYVTVKDITINASTTVVKVLTGDDANINDRAFNAILFGRKS